MRRASIGDPMADDDEADAQLRRELAALGWTELFDAVKYSRQQQADLRRIAANIRRARKDAEVANGRSRE
jgi:hypothetical protein